MSFCSGLFLPLSNLGKITTDGTTIIPVGEGGLSVVFMPVVAVRQDSTSYAANYDKKAGTFEVPGPDGKGIPVGKYRLSAFTSELALAARAPPGCRG